MADIDEAIKYYAGKNPANYLTEWWLRQILLQLLVITKELIMLRAAHDPVPKYSEEPKDKK